LLSRTVTLNGEVCKMVGKTKQSETGEPSVRGRIKLPQRTESIARVPVTPGSPLVGMTNMCELQEGVILAASLTKVVEGYVMTSILNTNDTEVDVQEPLVELDEFDSAWDRSCSTEFEYQDREKGILTQLRVEYLNMEEIKLLIQACSD